jgi:hypothetical protein
VIITAGHLRPGTSRQKKKPVVDFSYTYTVGTTDSFLAAVGHVVIIYLKIQK